MTKTDSFFAKMPSNKSIDLPDFTGCCGGGFKLSYIVSAPLHMKGIWQFWFSDNAGWLDKIAVLFDLVIHLSLWIAPLIMEIWGSGMDKPKGGDSFLVKELQAASMWALITAWIGIFIAQVFAFWGQDAGRLYPTTYGLIVGGTYASVIFSFLYIQYAMGTWPGYTATDDDSKDQLAALRKIMLWSVALKLLAVTTLKQNAAFWGPCSTDVVKEQAEQLAQTQKEYGVTSDGTMAARMA